MIGEALIDMFFGIFTLLFSTLEFLTLPTQLIGVLSTLLAYGVWIVGADILVLFVGTVVFWWMVHMSIGLAVWLWKMLPLT